MFQDDLLFKLLLGQPGLFLAGGLVFLFLLSSRARLGVPGSQLAVASRRTRGTTGSSRTLRRLGSGGLPGGRANLVLIPVYGWLRVVARRHSSPPFHIVSQAGAAPPFRTPGAPFSAPFLLLLLCSDVSLQTERIPVPATRPSPLHDLWLLVWPDRSSRRATLGWNSRCWSLGS